MHAPAEPRSPTAELDRSDVAEQLNELDWARIYSGLDAYGAATTGAILPPQMCRDLAAGFANASLFRAHIVMSRHGFGRGEYQYYAYPLPPLIAHLRAAFYTRLVPIAQSWNALLGGKAIYPDSHASYLAQCHAAGQRRPTPLLLHYEAGDFNCLHQDLYGDFVFPLQVAFLLSQPGQDFTGGEFVLSEQRPRMQSRAEVVTMQQGEAVIFAVHSRPMRGARGHYRVTLRHGVSRLRSGRRDTLGLIFHDAT